MVEAHKEELDHESKMEIKENQLEIDESEERKGTVYANNVSLVLFKELKKMAIVDVACLV